MASSDIERLRKEIDGIAEAAGLDSIRLQDIGASAVEHGAVELRQNSVFAMPDHNAAVDGSETIWAGQPNQ